VREDPEAAHAGLGDSIVLTCAGRATEDLHAELRGQHHREFGAEERAVVDLDHERLAVLPEEGPEDLAHEQGFLGEGGQGQKGPPAGEIPHRQDVLHPLRILAPVADSSGASAGGAAPTESARDTESRRV
jgi:hypothetical protein